MKNGLLRVTESQREDFNVAVSLRRDEPLLYNVTNRKLPSRCTRCNAVWSGTTLACVAVTVSQSVIMQCTKQFRKFPNIGEQAYLWLFIRIVTVAAAMSFV